MKIYSEEQAIQPHSGDSVPFPKAEGINSVDLYCSQMRKTTKQQDYTVPKCGRLKFSRFVPFPKAEGINSVDLYLSQMRKTLIQLFCTVRKMRKQEIDSIAPFARREGSKTT